MVAEGSAPYEGGGAFDRFFSLVRTAAKSVASPRGTPTSPVTLESSKGSRLEQDLTPSNPQSASKSARQWVSDSVAPHRMVRVLPVLTFVRSAQRVPHPCSTQTEPTRHSVPAVTPRMSASHSFVAFVWARASSLRHLISGRPPQARLKCRSSAGTRWRLLSRDGGVRVVDWPRHQ